MLSCQAACGTPALPEAARRFLLLEHRGTDGVVEKMTRKFAKHLVVRKILRIFAAENRQ